MTRGTTMDRFGEPAEVVRLETRQIPHPGPGPGRVRVRMRAAAINPSDLVSIRGAYAARTALPFRPGFEGVGTIEAGSPQAKARNPEMQTPDGLPSPWRRGAGGVGRAGL
ncbi:MAG: alcohol dehydrogenase catalytic domain-containing protein [Salinarimonas sp.]